ncbi:hypothetical protein [Nonomuraea sp. NPDC049784]|uniref:hypothetical protein n=1 Tax=Nonomuraea sp. NPDC049784 TaxID=3154361 RepID=UPI0033DE90D9
MRLPSPGHRTADYSCAKPEVGTGVATVSRPVPSPDLLTPDNAVMLFVDHQPQMVFGVGSGDRAGIINSTGP